MTTKCERSGRLGLYFSVEYVTGSYVSDSMRVTHGVLVREGVVLALCAKEVGAISCRFSWWPEEGSLEFKGVQGLVCTGIGGRKGCGR